MPARATQADPDPSPFLTRRSSGWHSLASTTPSNYCHYYYYYFYYYYYHYYFSLEKGPVLTNMQAASHFLHQPAVRIPFDE